METIESGGFGRATSSDPRPFDPDVVAIPRYAFERRGSLLARGILHRPIVYETRLSIDPNGPGCGESAYPQIRFVSLVDYGTHGLFGSRMAYYATGESALARAVLPGLGEGFGDNPIVTLNGVIMRSEGVDDRTLRFRVPPDHPGGIFDLVIESASERSAPVRVRVE